MLAAVTDAPAAQRRELFLGAYRYFIASSELTPSDLQSLAATPFALKTGEGGRAAQRALLTRFEALSTEIGDSENLAAAARLIVREYLAQHQNVVERDRERTRASARQLTPPYGVLKSESTVRGPVLLSDGVTFLYEQNRYRKLGGGMGLLNPDHLVADWATLVPHPENEWVLQLFARETQSTDFLWVPVPGQTPKKPEPFPQTAGYRYLGHATQAQISSDGTRLAIADLSTKQTHVFTNQAAGATVLSETSWLAGISADGKKIWYVTKLGTAATLLTHDLEKQVPSPTEAVGHDEWSVAATPEPGAAFAIGRDALDSNWRAPTTLAEIDIDSGRVTRKRLIDADSNTRLSPRGDYLVQVVHAKDRGFLAYLWSTKTLTKVASANFDSNFRGFSFSPDGKKILFTRDGYGVRPLGLGGVNEGFDVEEWARSGVLQPTRKP